MDETCALRLVEPEYVGHAVRELAQRCFAQRVAQRVQPRPAAIFRGSIERYDGKANRRPLVFAAHVPRGVGPAKRFTTP